MTGSFLLHSLALLAVAGAATAYTWPNPRMDALESLRWDQSGARGGLLGGFVGGCDPFIHGNPSQGRSNAADWLRTAYHDMSTHNATSGVGGLDASIQFAGEQQRPENPGDGFDNTILILKSMMNRYLSLSDGIALAAIYAVEACGGPTIDFRGGRVDAVAPGPTGVPEPQDTLESHKAAFARMGFTPTEMIQLVACGHTIGGVQSRFFPTIVPNSTVSDDNPDGDAPFDSSTNAFDNHIATDYISGSTANPLVVGANVSTRSDARIFSSDGNATMRAFAHSPSVFSATCAAILARMLNTVPRAVTLTDIIVPQAVKPDSVSLVRLRNGGFSLGGAVRFWNLDPDSDAAVSLLWADQSGQPCKNCSVALAPWGQFSNVGTTFSNHSALWYSFPRPGAAVGTAGISRFWFEVTQHGKTWVESQGGPGFPLQTRVLAADTSCYVLSEAGGILHMDIAVQKGLQPSLVYLVGDAFDSNDTPIPMTAASWPATFNNTATANSTGYDIYSVTVTSVDVIFTTVNVGATIGGKNVTDWTSLVPGDIFSTCT